MNVRTGVVRDNEKGRPKGNQNRHNSSHQNPQQHFRDEEEQSQWMFLRMRLNKGERGYGFAFIYDKSPHRKDDTIAVTKIVKGGVAQLDGRLKVNDVIVSVNNINLDEIPYVAAIETLRNTGPNMTLVIRRLKEGYHEKEVDDSSDKRKVVSWNNPDENANESDNDPDFRQFQVHLIKRSTGGLGIHIHGGYDEDDLTEEESYISISKIAPNGVADLDGNIRVGDILLQVDYQSLYRVTHERAVQILQNTGKGVTLFLGRFVEKKRHSNYQQVNRRQRNN